MRICIKKETKHANKTARENIQMIVDKFETTHHEAPTIDETKNRVDSTRQITSEVFKKPNDIVERFALSDEMYHQIDNCYLIRIFDFAGRWHGLSIY